MSSEELYCKGARVWLRDKELVWIPAEVVNGLSGKKITIQTEEDRTETILDISCQDGLPPLRNPDILVGENDLTTLSYLHEPAVLHNLKTRFLDSNIIYTYCGIVLVAINPYENVPLYGNEIIQAYHGQDMGDMDPHVFAVAEEAYKRMSRESRNQSIIVSGESGAGKTVSAKYAMRYFAMVGGASAETQIEKKVLASNPIMEAIGNAKTTRNDNSSRFGKYIEIGFDKRQHIIGAHMRTYLLEKSRVTFQSFNERNYHIFYQLCSARELPEMAEFYLEAADDFHYINQGDAVEIDDVSDIEEFAATQQAMSLLGLSTELQRSLLRVLAAILHLGNVTITQKSDDSHIKTSDNYLRYSAQLLGVDKDQLMKWLCNRKIATSKETYTKPLTLTQANSARDGLAKHLYAQLFLWVVTRINHSLTASSKPNSFIGVLDIYGFETFEVNSFEQFCINYANEKLQQQFNQHVFKLEQQEYIKEAIQWSFIEFYDNQPCIDLIEAKLGILDLLDETCKMPQPSDKMLIQKLYNRHEKKSSHFDKPRTSTSSFIIVHFADRVTYEAAGFVEKNMDSVVPEHLQLLKASEYELVAELFSDGKGSRKAKKSRDGPSALSKQSVGSQFRDSLSDLMKALNQTTPHYIRCIKPNDDKQAFTFDPKRAVQQLRACGVLETIRISAAGYPSRWTYTEFFDRYRMLLPWRRVRPNDVHRMCETILTNVVKDEDKFRFGKTKIFFRAGQVAYMEKLRSDKLNHSGIMIQKTVKGWIAWRKYQRLHKITILLQAHTRGLLARRHAQFLRETRAATLVQKRVRGYLCKSKYQRLRRCALAIQSYHRGHTARLAYLQLLYENKAIVIQRYARGWMARRQFKQSIRHVVISQCAIRRWLARRELKRLKIEARSVHHLKKLNQGLENKIIELQHKLMEQLDINKTLRTDESKLVELKREAAESAHYKEQLETAAGRIKELEQQLQDSLDRISVMEEKGAKEIAKLKQTHEERENSFLEKIRMLEAELESLKTQHQKDAKIISDGHSEEEWQMLQGELMELRDHHQRKLKDFARMEQRLENLQSEVELLRTQQGQMYSSESELSQSPGFVTPNKHRVSTTNLGDTIPRSLPDLRADIASSTPITKAHYFGVSGTISTPSNNFIDSSAVIDLQKKLDDLEKQNDHMGKELSELRNTDKDFAAVVADKQALLQEIDQLKEENKKISDGRKEQAMKENYEREIEILKESKMKLAEELKIMKQSTPTHIHKLPGLNQQMQQEVARLTDETLELREKLEYFEQQISHAKKQGFVVEAFKSNRQLSTSSMLSSPRPSDSIDHEDQYLGMLQWRLEDKDKILTTLVLKLHPSTVEGQIPCLPAHLLFMCLRYADHVQNEHQVTMLLEGVIKGVQQVVQKNVNNIDMLSFWLANVCRLFHNLKQYSGDENASHSYKSMSLTNFDLTSFRHLLHDRAVAIYLELVRNIQEYIQPLIVPGIMEHEAIPNISSSRRIGGKSGGGAKPGSSQKAKSIAVATIIKELCNVLSILQANFLDPAVISQLFKQIFLIINSFLLNNLLLRKDMCHWSHGMQIRNNLSQLEDWIRGANMINSGAIESLEPAVQATQLLQMRKKTDKDVTAIVELCDKLNTLQIQKILTMYTPADDYEERVPVHVIKAIAAKRGDNVAPSQLMETMDNANPVTFPFTPSDVNLRGITLPAFLKLDFLTRL